MPDRLVNLQRHLIGHQKQIAHAARAVRRGEQRKRLARKPLARAIETEAIEYLDTALRDGSVIAAERADLRIAVGMRGDRRTVASRI